MASHAEAAFVTEVFDLGIIKKALLIYWLTALGCSGSYEDVMLRRVGAFLVLLLFATQALAGGIARGIDAISSGRPHGRDSLLNGDDSRTRGYGRLRTGEIADWFGRGDGLLRDESGESTGGARSLARLLGRET